MAWRPDLRKNEIWYAAYGSSLWKPRFLCYIQGGKVDGMKKECSGSRDHTPPKDISWKTCPHRLFFGREESKTWGPGGVAFLSCQRQSNADDMAYLCLYKITLEQFNDLLVQENVYCDMRSPLFDPSSLDTVREEGSIVVKALKAGWYHNVFYLGTQHGIPILTTTCAPSHLEVFKGGKLPLGVKPSKEFKETMVRGLVEGGQLSRERAEAYVDNAVKKPL